MKFLLIGASLLIFIMGILLYRAGPQSQNFRLTMTIQTPNGPQKASVVRRVTIRYSWTGGLADITGTRIQQTGEMFALPLERKRTIFVPLDIEEHRTLSRLTNAFPTKNTRAANKKDKLRAWFRGVNPGEPVDLVWRKYLPTLVVFDDIADYRTIRALDSEEVQKLLGEGYSSPTFTVQLTDDPITIGAIDGFLTWVDDVGPQSEIHDDQSRKSLTIYRPFGELFRKRVGD